MLLTRMTFDLWYVGIARARERVCAWAIALHASFIGAD